MAEAAEDTRATVTFYMPASNVPNLNRAAKLAGKKRSEYIRDIIVEAADADCAAADGSVAANARRDELEGCGDGG